MVGQSWPGRGNLVVGLLDISPMSAGGSQVVMVTGGVTYLIVSPLASLSTILLLMLCTLSVLFFFFFFLYLFKTCA